MKKKLFHLAFAAYGLWMLWLLFGQRMTMGPVPDYAGQLRQNLNLVPFETIRRFWWVLKHSTDAGGIRHAIVNLAGNVVMFIPLGVFLPGIWKRLRKFRWFLPAVTLLIAAVELLQLVTLLGSCDVDDLILNLIGAVLGFGLWKLLAPKT